MTYTDKLREEWNKCWLGPGEKPEVFDKCADFWLSKHNTLLNELETEIKKYKCGGHKRLLAFIETKR